MLKLKTATPPYGLCGSALYALSKLVTGLSEKDIPTHFLNINFYLKKYLGKLPDPPLNPVTRQPIKGKDLAPIFPMELIKQEISLEIRP